MCNAVSTLCTLKTEFNVDSKSHLLFPMMRNDNGIAKKRAIVPITTSVHDMFF